MLFIDTHKKTIFVGGQHLPPIVEVKHVVGVSTRRALPLLGKWALLPSFLLVSDARSKLSQDKTFKGI